MKNMKKFAALALSTAMLVSMTTGVSAAIESKMTLQERRSAYSLEQQETLRLLNMKKTEQ